MLSLPQLLLLQHTVHGPGPGIFTSICQLFCLPFYRKSQNYIHGYQNLSYAIHITIATALLFVLLAALQIFGAICISSSRQNNIVDVDWLQWGYQFSLRLIEIAIITLISWVTGLKTSAGHDTLNAVNVDVRMVGSGVGPMGAYSPENGGSTNNAIREKNVGNGTGTHNSNMTNFFLPCTSSSSQEQFEGDYPAICNANTNLHTYTMRTGKLIYDDSYALNSIGPTPTGSSNSRPCEYQLQEPMYQRPYDTGSIGSAVNSQNGTDYGNKATQNYKQQHQMHFHEQPTYMSTDYMTDAASDHYENPNFNLRTANSTKAEQMQKEMYDNNGVGSTLGSGSTQHQVVLLKNDNCYSEPHEQENKRYEFNIFERPVFKDKSGHNIQSNSDCFEDRQKITNGRVCERKFAGNGTLERNFYENKHPERRSSNSKNSCSSSNGGGRYASYSSYERGFFNGVCKSGTLGSIAGGGITLSGAVPGRSLEVPSPPTGSQRIIANGAQTLGISDRDRAQYYQRVSGRTSNLRSLQDGTGTDSFTSVPVRQHQLKPLSYEHNSEDEEEEEEDDIISGSNVECTNLINNDNGSVIADDSAPSSISIIGKTSLYTSTAATKNLSNDPLLHANVNAQLNIQNTGKLRSELCTASSASVASASSNSCTTSSASDSMLVADQGFLRFRSIEDQNSAQNGNNLDGERAAISSLRLKSCSATVSGIDC
ncbi:uncharacterized protein LOC108024912 isoform X2 [Drosophila biarmipes]|uniref:uncharacterized protein LOC108024912 isoform X2 n=1 Tax=Drosophila biarmipes TaxID=125945 RepID=UPI0021CC946D|nr:uncharacterized protein LOC108024912 isoform X2 [Drosophila biarmipes]